MRITRRRSVSGIGSGSGRIRSCSAVTRSQKIALRGSVLARIDLVEAPIAAGV
jgi:hypothetical protein